jgi:uroporphyrinogen-III synthase
MYPPKLLIIRAEQDAVVTAERAQAAGFEPIVMPLFKPARVDWTVPGPDGYDAILITSANAMRYGGRGLPQLMRLPVYAVGNATADAARSAGFTVIAAGTSGGADILQRAFDDGCKRILWLSGSNATAIDARAEMQIDQIIVYEAAALPVPDNIAEILRQDNLITALHSPRSAAYFAQVFDKSATDRSTMALAVLSPAVAQAVGTGWRKVAVASAPSDTALLAAAKSVFTT